MYKQDINKHNPLGQKGYLAEAYANLMNNMWRGKNRAVSASALKKRIVVNAGQFSGYGQHDSQELIMYMLDGLNEDLNRIKKKPYVEVKEYPNMPDEELSKKRWDEYIMRNKSIITDIFIGQLRSRLVCPLCKKISIAFDPFMILNVPIPQFHFMSLMYVPSDFTKAPLLIKVKLLLNTLLSEVDELLRDALKATKNDLISYAIVKDRGIYRQVSLDTVCTSINKNIIYVYHMILPENTLTYDLLEVRIRYVSIGVIYNSTYPCDFPLLFPVPLNNTAQQIKLDIFKRLIPFTTNPKSLSTIEEISNCYKKCFIANGVLKPYTVSILNNRKKTGTFRTTYENCEYCNKGHSNNCPFEFDDDKIEYKDIIEKIKGKRPFIIDVLINHKSKFIQSERIQKHLNETNKSIRELDMVSNCNTKITLYDCLECFSNEEQLDEHNMWHCPTCKKHVMATKKMNLYKLPNVIVIHLKRFRSTSEGRYMNSSKIGSYIEYPMKNLDMKKYTMGPEANSNECLYDLFAVSKHSGGLSGGHYVATCYNTIANSWFYFNDSSVTKANQNDVVSSEGYVLFYRKVNTK